LDAPEDADDEWLIYEGLKPTAPWSGVVALTTSSANGGGKDLLVDRSPSFATVMGSHNMP
jgi:hypothetical protein